MKNLFKYFLLFAILAFFLTACCEEEVVKKKVVINKPAPKPVVKVVKKAPPKPTPLPKVVPPKDDDMDGVINKFDKCPNTLRCAPVDYQGCWHIGMVYFDFDKYNIKPEYYKTLDEIAYVVKQNPSVELQVMCHTDAKGSKKYNIALSKKRCEAVKNYLINKGVFPGRIITLYYGETKPVAPNDTARHRAFNRRAEFKILR